MRSSKLARRKLAILNAKRNAAGLLGFRAYQNIFAVMRVLAYENICEDH
jgi:hypothetical protein